VSVRGRILILKNYYTIIVTTLLQPVSSARCPLPDNTLRYKQKWPPSVRKIQITGSGKTGSMIDLRFVKNVMHLPLVVYCLVLLDHEYHSLHNTCIERSVHSRIFFSPSGFREAAPARLPAPGSFCSHLDSLSASFLVISSSGIFCVASDGKESTGVSPTKCCLAAAMFRKIGAKNS
jgi:hypothetical protein